MASDDKQQKFELAEYDRAYEAYGEYKTNGRTDLLCLRCGYGHFNFIEVGTSVEIRCDSPGCVVARVRGI